MRSEQVYSVATSLIFMIKESSRHVSLEICCNPSEFLLLLSRILSTDNFIIYAACNLQLTQPHIYIEMILKNCNFKKRE